MGCKKRAGLLPPPRSAVVELAGGLLRAGYRHRAALACNQPLVFGRLVLIGFTKALPAEQENLGVFHESVGHSGGDGGVMEDIAPLGEGGVFVVMMVERF